jgi:hypothetical protein
LQRQRAADQDHVRIEAHELFRLGADAPGVGSAPAIVDADVAAVGPAQLLEGLPERRDVGLHLRIVLGERIQHANPSDAVGLLRSRRERPCRRAAEQRDELASLHSITSSARNRNESEIVNPSALAVVRFMTRSNLVGCSTGMSAGFAPRRILSMKSPARLKRPGTFGP